MKTLKKLEKVNFKYSTSDDIKNILSQVKLLIVHSILIKGTIIVRSRDKEGCCKKSEMTYSPYEVNDCKRASLKKQTMFYGVISDDCHSIENAEVISIAEISKLCRKGKLSVGFEKFSVSYWEVEKPLKVASFITDKTFPDVQNNVSLNKLRNSFKEKCKDPNVNLSDIEIARFISTEYTKKVNTDVPYEYLISATLSDIIINEFGYDAVVFPSVQFNGKAGLNIAISPNVVDNKLLFMGTSQEVLYKNKDKSIVRKENEKMIQFPDSIIEKELGIDSIKSLPFCKE